ncbi:MAG: serine/threonine-protein kinase, partial [Myxococcota bacterium]
MPDSLDETRSGDTVASLGRRGYLGGGALERLELEIAQERSRAAVFEESARPVGFGRYVLLDRIGRGGMGVVYKAYDPKLDRAVALKLLRSDLDAGAAGHDRLLAEAQALAKLAHPNVVAIHDAGTVGEQSDAVFLAMEYVEGVTLRGWLGEATRGVPEILAVVVAAGRGLAAAHARGLVHRDFKPDNVMIGDDGRVRVMDFGLARAATGLHTSEVAIATLERTPSPPDRISLTQSGRVAGSPAYMAPEQFDGDDVGPASDQFGFCVSLWEALYGLRPFPGETPAELCAAMLDGRIESSDLAGRVPGWLETVVRRGLSADAADRWPTMDALLDALLRGRTRARRRRARNIAAVVAVAGLAAAGTRSLLRRQAIARCEASGGRIAELWPGHADDVRRGILATGLPYAGSTAERLVPRMDTWAAAWRNARTTSCLQHEVEGTRSTELHRRAQGCLDVQFASANALVEEFAAARNEAVYGAAKAIARRPDPAQCLDPLRLERGAWPDDEDWAATVDLRTSRVNR